MMEPAIADVMAEATKLGFLDTIVEMLEQNEFVRGVVSSGLMAVLSVPMAAIGQGLKMAPDWIVPPESIPAWLAFVGLLAGVAVGFYTPLSMDLGMTVGMGSGLGAKAAHDLHRKYRPNQITKED